MRKSTFKGLRGVGKRNVNGKKREWNPGIIRDFRKSGELKEGELRTLGYPYEEDVETKHKTFFVKPIKVRGKFLTFKQRGEYIRSNIFN